MNPSLSAVLGGLAVGGLIAVYGIGVKITTLFRRYETLLTNSASNTEKLTIGLDAVRKPLEGLHQELAYMRSIATVAQGSEEQQTPQGPPQSYRPPVAYPGPVYDRYAVVPDATNEDTDRDALLQEDSEMIDVERVENLRDRGIFVEDDNTHHEGVVVDSE